MLKNLQIYSDAPDVLEGRYHFEITEPSFMTFYD